MKFRMDLMYGNPRDGEENKPLLPEQVNDLKERLRKGHDFARNKLKLASRRTKFRFDPKAKSVTFDESDAVWLFKS